MPGPNENALSDLEKLLAALPPRPTTLDRDHLLFRAGQVSMKRSWIWPLVAVIMSVAAGCLAMILVLQPMPEPVLRIVHVEVPMPAPEMSQSGRRETGPDGTPNYRHEAPSPTLSYLRMQQQALRFGVEGLPQPASEGDNTPEGTAVHGPDISAGSRPKVMDHASLFLSFGER